MKAPAAENARIKRMYVEVSMQCDLLKDALKKVTRPCDREELAKQAVLKKQASIRLTCATFGISETCYRYERRLSEENDEIVAWLHYLTRKHKRWGFALCFFHLRNVCGFGWNHKRVYPIYKREDYTGAFDSRSNATSIPEPKIAEYTSCHQRAQGINGSRHPRKPYQSDKKRPGFCR